MPDPFGRAIRSGVTISYTIDASRDGVPVAGALGMEPVGGNWDDDANRDGRRSLSLELAPKPGLFGLLAPTGTILTPTCHVTYSGTTVTLPCGVYDVDSENSGEVGGTLRIQAPDKWARIKRARFGRPKNSTPAALVRNQIASLITEATGEVVTVTSTSTVTVGRQLWERDLDKTIVALAKSAGIWVFYDRNGVPTVADLPTLGTTADWTIDSGTATTNGVLTSVDRERNRERTYNVVVVSTSRTDGVAPFEPVVLWDNDPDSPTFAGLTHPFDDPNPGPFGVVPYFYDSPLLRTTGQAATAGLKILHRVVGLASQVNLGSVPNPAIDALDVLDVAPPKERYDIPRPLERHMADKVTNPLITEDNAEQRIQGRSTRTDEYT